MTRVVAPFDQRYETQSLPVSSVTGCPAHVGLVPPICTTVGAGQLGCAVAAVAKQTATIAARTARYRLMRDLQRSSQRRQIVKFVVFEVAAALLRALLKGN